MTSINKVSSAQQTNEAKNEQQQGQRAFLNQEADKVNISKTSTRKKVGIGLAIAGLVYTAGILAYSIGRNPAKAAKALKGNENIVTQAYEQGQKIAEEIMTKEGSFKTTIESVMQVFRKPPHKSNLSGKLEQLEKYIKEKNIPEDSALAKSVKKIKQNLDVHLSKQEQDLINGAERELDSGKKFIEQNKGDFEIISEHFNGAGFGTPEYSFLDNFRTYNIYESDVALIDHIRECPAGVLPNDGIFYHGTTKAGKVYQSGMTPFVSNQLESYPRELGAGIYTTPDARVAASFSGILGTILPVRLAEGSKIAMVSEDAYKYYNQSLSKYIAERMTPEEIEKLPKDVKNATMECLTRKMFQHAGYDAAYIPKGVKGGGLFAGLLNPNINEVIGANQSQVVVFSPEKLSVAPRSFKERVCDLKLKFEGLYAQLKWQHEHPFGF